MNTRTSFLKRCLALAMALVLFVTSSNLGIVLQASAATAATVTTAELVASNYSLTDAEKALLNSNKLAGTTTISYSVPEEADNLVAVDSDAKTITASAPEGWTADTAEIVVGGETKETVALTAGVGTYTYAGNAFAVKVNFSLKMNVDGQDALIGNIAKLKADMATGDAVVAMANNLSTLAIVIDTLNGMLGTLTAVGATAEMTGAVTALYNQKEANANKELNLYNELTAYKAGKTAYLETKAAAMKAEVASLMAALAPLSGLENVANSLAGNPLFASYAGQIRIAVNTINSVAEALVAVADDAWHSATAALTVGADATTDALAAAVTGTTAVTVKNPLNVAAVSIQQNMSMFNVTVNVVLNVVENAVDSTTLVEAGAKSVVIAVDENASASAIKAAVDANGVEAAAKAEWAAYVDGKFEAAASTLPDALTEDITYTITYSPKNFEVKTDYAGTASYPYGYKMTLPVHTDAMQAYDYKVNGEAKVQGAVITITGDTEIIRSTGKAYTNSDLYTIIADNNGNDYADEILKSGALNGNQAISVRKPDPEDADSLLTLEGNVLTAQAAYDAAYNGLSWAPYTYGDNGTENAFSGNTADWTAKTAKMKYILKLTNLEDDAKNIQTMVAQLKTEADAQVATLNKLAANTDAMGDLNNSMLGALGGMINSSMSLNAEMKAFFSGVVANIQNTGLDTNGKLKIYNMLVAYQDANNGGLLYYYQNNAAVLAEINSLATALSAMLETPEKQAALAALLAEAGYGQYASKITSLESAMAEVKANLKAPHVAINIHSENLYKLTGALAKNETVAFTGDVCPYLVSETLTVTDDSQVTVQLHVEIGEKSEYFSVTKDKNATFTQADADSLKAQAEAFAAKELGTKAAYYTADFSGLQAQVGTELSNKSTTVSVAYAPIVYTVAIEGVDGVQTITIENTNITLPKHNTAGWVYEYTVFEKTIEVDSTADKTVALTEAQLSQFGSGIYTIARKAINKAAEDLEDDVSQMKYISLTKDADGNTTGIKATVPPTIEGISGMAAELVKLGYSYIELNGKPLMETTTTTTISLQTLMDAILADNTFGSQTLIDLSLNNGGKVFSAKMNLGTSAESILFSGLDFVFAMDGTNKDMATIAQGLTTISPYMTFQSKDGALSVKANLPEKVYELYLTALLATGNVDKEDMNAVNDEIAYMFLWDYVDMILNSDANTTTFTNTLATFGVNRDLSGYEKYYQMLKKAVNHPGVTINDPNVPGFDMSAVAGSKAAIEKIFALIGMDLTNYTTVLGMIKEYQEGETLSVNVLATLGNLPTSYEALVLDLGVAGSSSVSGYLNLFDYTEDLPARTGSITGQSLIILLDDVDGNLSFPHSARIDLNGFKVNGNIGANGDLWIVDSRLGTTSAGEVTGTVSTTNNMSISGGKFAQDVTAYLKDGYKQVDGYVQNALYTIESNGDTATIVVNSDYLAEVEGYLPHVQTLAVDIAVDVALNYFTAAALSVDGNNLYTINFYELISLLTNGGKVDGVLDRAVDSLNHEGITGFANALIADLLDFGAIAEGLKNGTPVAAYTVSTNPWIVNVDHIADKDVLDLTLTANDKIEKALNIQLVVKGSNAEKLISRLDELNKIVTVKNVNVNLADPDYVPETNTVNVAGNAKAEAVIDLTTNPEYLNVIAVYMASVVDADTKADLIVAVENDYYDVIKAAFDSATAQKIFTGLKNLSRKQNFVQFAEAQGFTNLSEETKRIGNLYHLLMCGAGKALEVLKIQGPNAEMAGLVEDGTYTLNRTFKREGTPSYRGYAVNYDLESVDVSLTVKVWGPTIIRITGADRSHTALEIAEKMKNTLNVKKFNSIVLAAGNDFPDALSGSFLAIKEEAPILLYREKYMADTINYIAENLAADGKVYILGGTAAVSAEMEAALVAKDILCERIKGATRWETNLAILAKGNASAAKELVVASGRNYADVMTASATGMPILLLDTIGNKLTADQEAFLKDFSGKITIFGGTGAVSEELENAVEAITGTDIQRVKGATREATAKVAAEMYYNNPDTAVVAYSRNFPDGLCGGPLAYTMGAPLLLVNEGEAQYKFAADYVDEKDVTIGYVLGGEAAVSDATAKAVFNDATIIKHRFDNK